MFDSFRAYLRLSHLARAYNEAQLRQFTNLLDATRVCNQLFRIGHDYSVVKDKDQEVFWVVRTKLAKALIDEGHLTVKPPMAQSSKKVRF